MEARLKLQAQLDTLLTRTSAKMTNLSNKEEESEDVSKTSKEETPRPETPKVYPEVDTKVKSLIKSVAHEIQKSFSQRNLDLEQTEDNEKEEEFENARDDLEERENEVKQEIKSIQEPSLLAIPEEPVLEAPIDFDAAPAIRDTSIHREKVRIVRKSSQERRLPASIVAKKKAAEKLKDLLSNSIKAAADDDSNISK